MRVAINGFGRIGLLVSSDIIGNHYSSVFDSAFTRVSNKRYLKCLSWYDNEWGYSNRVCDLLSLLERLDHPRSARVSS